MLEHSAATRTTGAPLGAPRRPPRRFARGRICRQDGCGTRLSVYNDGAFCSLHAPKEAPRVRGEKVIWPRTSES